MKKNSEFDEITKIVNTMIHDTTNSANFQKCKVVIDEVLKGVGVVLDDVFDETKKAKIVTHTEVEGTPVNAVRTKKASPRYPKKINKIAKFTVKKIPVAPVGGVLFTIFGAIATLISAGTTFALSMYFFLTHGTIPMFGSVPIIHGAVALLAMSTAMLTLGIVKIKRNTRFKRYRISIGDSLVYSLDSLADDVGKRRKVVMRDLKRMRIYGYIRHSYFDKDKKSIILSYEAYTEDCIKQQVITNTPIVDKIEQEAPEVITEAKSESEKELCVILEKGQQQLLEINALNQLVKGSLISVKIAQFHNITTAIFSIVQKTPHKMNDIRKVHDYYLPTVIKLLNMYVKLDDQIQETENIIESKHQITIAIETLNIAFKELLNCLFDDEALDIYADISVLNTILTQDGLINNDDFKKN